MTEHDQHPVDPSAATKAVTAGRSTSGSSLAPALWASSTWQSADLADARRRATGTRAGEFYSRYSNPTVRAFEEAIAELKGAESSLALDRKSTRLNSSHT